MCACPCICHAPPAAPMHHPARDVHHANAVLLGDVRLASEEAMHAPLYAKILRMPCHVHRRSLTMQEVICGLARVIVAHKEGEWRPDGVEDSLDVPAHVDKRKAPGKASLGLCKQFSRCVLPFPSCRVMQRHSSCKDLTHRADTAPACMSCRHLEVTVFMCLETAEQVAV
jgi:hypothetical protein